MLSGPIVARHCACFMLFWHPAYFFNQCTEVATEATAMRPTQLISLKWWFTLTKNVAMLLSLLVGLEVTKIVQM